MKLKSIRNSLLVKLLNKKNRELYFLYGKLLGFYPRDIELYHLALRHKSLSIRQEDGLLLNNERLEFLGDAVLNVLVTDLLFHHFDRKEEGFLTKIRSRIVNRETLNNIAVELGLDKLMVTANNVSSPRYSIFGNTLEAFIGAIYLDAGYKACKRFLEKKIMERFIDIEDIASHDENFKSLLLEWGQHQKATVEFRTLENKDSEKHAPLFDCLIYINGSFVSDATSYSKKKAQQLAAQKALETLQVQRDNSPR